MFDPDIPSAIVVPAHETNVLRAVNRPRVLVLHTPEEPADERAATPIYFQTPFRGASTHYFASWGGNLYQLVPEANGALANGVLGKPYPADTDPAVSLNYQSLSIEIEGYAATIAETLTAAQRATVARWIADCARRHGIPLDRQHVIGHYEVASNRSDPGTLDIDDLIAAAKEETMNDKERLKALEAEVYYGVKGVLASLDARVTALEKDVGFGVHGILAELDRRLREQGG